MHGHPGLYIADASVIPANLGVNPSLTITALAERFASLFPAPLRDKSLPPEATEQAPTVRTLARQWQGLTAPRPEDLLHDVVGDLVASFVPPLTHIAPPGLGLIGLRHWRGKRFRPGADGVEGVNLVRRGTELVETMPMALAAGTSLADGRPTLVVTYEPTAPRPWRWVRDEIRWTADGTALVGMTLVDLPGLRRLGGTPFLLTPERR